MHEKSLMLAAVRRRLPIDLSAHGRQETWEESPAGWPQDKAGSWWRRDGRPIAQWTRTDEAVK